MINLILTIVFSTLLIIPANGADLKNMVLPNNRTVTITGHPDYPPVMWVNKETGKFQGVAIELLEKMLSEVNIKPVFINVENWARAQEQVKNGQIDILLPPYKTEDRKKFFNFSTDAFMKDETVVFVKKGKEFKFESFDDLLKYPGVAIINDSFGEEFDNFEKKAKHIRRLPNTDQSFRFVDKDRARYIVAGINSGNAAIAKLNWEDRYVYLPKRIIVTGLYPALSKKSVWNFPEFNNYLNQKYKEYNKAGIVKHLEKKYLTILKEETLKKIPSIQKQKAQ